jgi:hypothetical protein
MRQRRWSKPSEKVVRTPDHQFIRYLMHEFHRLPDDPFYEHINPYLKVWLYESWLHDKELEVEKLKEVAILIGSFHNPEMAYKMMKNERPDFASTDLDETSKMVREQILESQRKDRKKRKKRKVVS